jgi:hypothetical protein
MSKTSTIPEMQSFVSEDPRWALVQRIAFSQHLKTSHRLRDFLLYVGECAVRGAPEEATEQQIGIHVFDRAPGYNSSEDSIVRTHARLLRQKLGEYFGDEGASEEMVLEIPKGHYLPAFRIAEHHPGNPALHHDPIHDPDHAHDLHLADSPSPLLAEPSKTRGLWWKSALGVVVLALFFLLGIYFGHTRGTQPKPPANPAMETLWRPFFSGTPPLVIYSNALFVGNSKTGLRYAPSTGGSPLPDAHHIETYTGIGEVASVYDLARLFDSHQAQFILKRSLLVTWDEGSLKNLIFIGSRAENPSLKVLPDTTDFTMMSDPNFSGIVNHHPRPGELALYSRPEHPLTKDYAILALLPGVQPGKWILICSGLTTFGTQAAVEFVTRPDMVEQLFRAGAFPNEGIHPFEAVLETTIAGGVPIETKLVAIRTH